MQMPETKPLINKEKARKMADSLLDRLAYAGNDGDAANAARALKDFLTAVAISDNLAESTRAGQSIQSEE